MHTPVRSPVVHVGGAAAVLLSDARFPVIVTGEGVILLEGRLEASKKLAEELSAPVCCNYLHNDVLPGRHPWS